MYWGFVDGDAKHVTCYGHGAVWYNHFIYFKYCGD